MRKDNFDPLQKAISLIGRVNRLTGAVFEGQRTVGGTARGQWHPLTDVYETAEGIVVCMEVAGVDPTSIEVNFTQRQLTVSGYRAAGHSSGRCHQAEIENGRFSRTVFIPIDIDEDGIRATSRHGLLQISLPRRKEAEPRKVSISDESEDSK